MRISACIDMMYAYCDFYQRFSEVKKSGIHTVEFWKWSNKDIDRVCRILQENEMSFSIFNLDTKNEALSYDLSRGILNDGRAEDLIKAVEESIPVYRKLNATAMIVLIGENKPFHEENVLKCLMAVKPLVEREGVNLIVEPLNNIDRVGYSMPYCKPVFSVLKKVNSPNIKLLYDIYHQMMMDDFSMEDIKANLDFIGHFHVADAPGRHEPGTGNGDYVSILKEINQLPYTGFVGLEYRATKSDGETLHFLKEAENV